MPQTMSKTDIMSMLLNDKEDKEIEEEEMMHLLVQRKLSKNLNNVESENLSIGAKAADSIAKFAGSWRFIIIFISCLLLWIIVNVFLLTRPFDAYPFILLNLILSCVAAIQAPVIMMSQNRQEEKDRLRSQNDYETNLKAEIIIEDLHLKLDQLLENQNQIMQKLQESDKSDSSV